MVLSTQVAEPGSGQPHTVCMSQSQQHDLKVATINVKQVTIFNDFVDSQWFSEPMHALPSMNLLLQTAKLRLLDYTR